MSNKFNFELPYADTLSKTVAWTDSSGTPIDLTGYTAVFAVFDSDGNILLTLTETSGLTLGGTAGTIGIFSEVCEPTGTPIAPGCYSYFLQVSGSATQGVVHVTLIEGEFTIGSPG